MSNVYTPDGNDLRRAEREVLIPKKMREYSRSQCVEEMKEFEKCCKGRTVSMVFLCRKQNIEMQDCLVRNYTAEGVREKCTLEYLEQRRVYRSSEKYKKTYLNNKQKIN